MKATPIFGLSYPEGAKDPPDGAGQIQTLAEELEAKLEAIEQLIKGAPAPGNLVVVNGTSDPVYKAATGDVTINSAGVTQVGVGKIFEAMLADANVTSRKMKQTVGVVTSTAQMFLGEVYGDLPGGSLEITPAVPSNLLVTTTFRFNVAAENAGPAGTINVDGVDDTHLAETGWTHASYLSASFRPMATQVYVVPLTAALHTIKLRAKHSSNTGLVEKGARMMYQLVAS